MNIATPPYFTQEEAEAFIGSDNMHAIYDDASTGQINTGMVNFLGNMACKRVDGFIATVYPGPFPLTDNPTPSDVKLAALYWFKAMSYERAPEYVRQNGKDAKEEAQKFSKQLVEANEFLTDYKESPTPETAGGIVYSSGPRMIIDGGTGTNNGGDF